MTTQTEEPMAAQEKRNRNQQFVAYIIKHCAEDTGIRAALKRADNPVTEYKCWDVLAGFRINLEDEKQRVPYAAIAATIARVGPTRNGKVGVGRAIARCYEDGAANDQAKAKLRRLLACDSSEEACRILHPIFSLIAARGVPPLDYARLLTDLLWFDQEEHQLRTKARWAQDFYARSNAGGDDEQ
jgi:CRISPR system Cascade subunit CasB